MEKVNAREWVAAICDAVEDVLAEYDIKIPDEDREWEDTEACLYGRSYDMLATSVQDILSRLTKSVKENSEANFDFSEY